MTVFKSFLKNLTEILASKGKFKIEQDSLIEIGCYLYRASSIISQISENNPGTANEILQSLSTNDGLAKNILGKLQKCGEKKLSIELKNTLKQLQGIINQIGEGLSSIEISAFKNKKYVEIACYSLSEEMRRAQFHVTPVSETNPINRQILKSNPEEYSDLETTPTEVDLYSISTEVCTEYSHISDIPNILDALRNSSQGSQRGSRNASNRSLGGGSRSGQYKEPMYKSFICPLTNAVMDDPVTIEGGVTYERKAITEYFESFGSDEVICPATRDKLQSKSMSSNIALKNIIQEWKDRDETARLRAIRNALSMDSKDDTVLEALNQLKSIWEKDPQKIVKVRKLGITPLVVRLLGFKDRKVRCAVLDMICLLAQEEEEEKELIGRTPALSSTIRMLSSSHQPIRHAALLLLIELSKSKSLSKKIGYITGGILILIQTKYNRSIDAFASEAADQVLKNMEQCSINIKFMAENGCLDPLLNNLIEGDEERKLEMVTYLGEMTLEDDSKTYVAKRASLVLAEMLHNGDPSTRLAVFKALAQISSNAASGIILVKSGIIGTMVQEMFAKIFCEPMDSLQEAFSILTNILESGVELENLMVNSQGESKNSGYVVFNIIYMIKTSTMEDMKISLIRILYHMAKSSKSANLVLSAVKESEVSNTLIELLNNPRDEIAIAAINLLNLLLPQLGNLLIDQLCKTNGQPEGLVQITSNTSQYTERQALSVSFLAKVPHQNFTLNLALVRKNTIPGVLQLISQALKNGRRNEMFASMYLDGLVGIIVRITATLYDPQMLIVAINNNFTSVLAELLTETSSNEVQRLAATGLEKLSAQSIHLSKPPLKKRKKFLNLFYLPKFLLFELSRKNKANLCIAHKGVCFKQNTLCLIEAKAVDKLLTCLEHQNAEVSEASLSAISTLLDDNVNLKPSVDMLSEKNAIQQVLKAIRQHKIESLWQKAFWMMERFLRIGGQRSVSIVSQDKLFFVTVVTAFHHGDAYTRQMAEKILRYLNRMPTLSGTFTM